MRRFGIFNLVFAATSIGLVTAQEPRDTPSVEAFLKAWGAEMKGITSLRVEFTQTKKLRILRRPLVSTGFTLLKGKRVLMVVNGRDGKRSTELLVEPDAVRMYYPRLRKLEVYPVIKGAPRTPFVLFGEDLEALPETHDLRLEKDGDLDLLIMVPKDPKATEKETRLRFKDYVVVSMTQVNTKGDEIELAVSKFQKNAPVSDAEVAIHPKEGTKVIEVLPSWSKQKGTEKND
jgi:outer membrane lipoprotein-sorting protein